MKTKKKTTGPEKPVRTDIVEKVEAVKQAAALLEASIEEFKSVEKALEYSEARYQLLVRHSSDGVFLFSPVTLKILEANTSFLQMMGYTEKEITSITVPDIIVMPKKDILLNIKHVLKHTEHVSGLRQYRRKDGSLTDVEITSSLIRHKGEQFIMVNVRDVTERLRAQHELERQANILRDQAEIIDIAEDAIIVRDTKDQIIFWNRGAENRFGFSGQEAIGCTISQLLKTEYSEPRAEIRKQLFTDGKWEGELSHRAKNGQEIIVDSKWKLRTDKKGKPLAILQIDNDITHRKQAENILQKSKQELELRVVERTSELLKANSRLVQELKRRQQVEDMLRRGAERYKNLFENSPLGIYRTNPDGKILMANPTLIRMMGYASFDEFYAVRSFKKSCEPTYLNKKIKDRLEREGRVRGFEARWKVGRNGTVMYVMENARAIRDAEGKTLYYEGTVEDITERKKAEESIDQYQRQLRSLASELTLAEERERRRISSLLHDHIGQLHATAKMKLGLLESSVEDHALKKEINEIRELIGQAIHYGRTLTFELSPPILYDLGLEPAVEWLTEQLEEQNAITCAFENDGSLKPISDEIRVLLFTAVRELLVNVVKHAAAQHVKITIRRIDDSISIHVADDGTGFNASKKSYHLAEARGYGLFSIRERLHSLGGHMDVRSWIGRGTRIVLQAPLKRGGDIN
ncbi:MAG: PAS domain S-box protein [Syntrophorhabdaceae bacterium]|nr:PAS domain S-box protein [Syntrophorhabdaceae bacterium]MDD4195039.1 PAS domain S-box protein [Syntrophorhabdaceae bacterium]